MNRQFPCTRSLIASFDWAGTRLGVRTYRPQRLRTTIDIVLNSRWIPVQIC